MRVHVHGTGLPVPVAAWKCPVHSAANGLLPPLAATMHEVHAFGFGPSYRESPASETSTLSGGQEHRQLGIGGSVRSDSTIVDEDQKTAGFRLTEWLPDWLLERTRVVRDGALTPDDPAGGHVLYWMHHAVRGHENPALDTAKVMAAQLGLPLLVYQGLGGRHPFNNDRHHTFILQGARDGAAELAAQGIQHVFWLPDDPESPSPLVELARRSAVIVTEDFPAPPFPKWTTRLAERSERPTVVVDTSCVVPMRLVPGTHDRAFRFRDKTKKLFRQRADQPYPEITGDIPSVRVEDLGFEPTDLATLDIAAACARCRIDHGVGPVAHTHGGSVAGYKRWESFKAKGLRGYHKRRNTAEIKRGERSVSRMSPYLHHGHVSPFRLMCETRALLDGPCREGAEKFIDELWVWRELAHHLAFTRSDDLHSTHVLPKWARNTIAAHADDPREVLDGETLDRGRTGDALWDAAQHSLVAQGELHNNVRMTWGKALLGWHAGARPTLRTLIELNHRYALDGSDPNSYGGLLWCLGVFDRPFNQDEPIYGSLRTRPTEVHANRMNLGKYQRQVARPAWGQTQRVAIVGGGLAGLAAARTLVDQNVEVTVYDKGRGPGGRASTRRRDTYRFDHGAQYFTSRDSRFRRLVEAWCQQGIVAEWKPRLTEVNQTGTLIEKSSSDIRYVGVPGMNAFVRHLSETLEPRGQVRFGREVADIEWEQGEWKVTCDNGQSCERFDALILAVPAPQAAALLAGNSELAGQIESVGMEPCWAGMYAFQSRVSVEADGIFVNAQDSPLAWACRDSSKPGRPEGERWVLHAKSDWTREHLDLTRDAVASLLLDAFADAVGVEPPQLEHSDAHRWRYALGSLDPAPEQLFDRPRRLAVGGDWCAGGRIEGAYLSGVAAAGRILGDIVQSASFGPAAEQETLFS